MKCRSTVKHYRMFLNYVLKDIPNIRTELLDQSPGGGIIMARRAPDMDHEDSDALKLQQLVFGIFQSYVPSVAVPVNADKGLELPDAVGEGDAATEISGMPDDVNGRKELLELIAENAVGVGNETYVHSTCI